MKKKKKNSNRAIKQDVRLSWYSQIFNAKGALIYTYVRVKKYSCSVTVVKFFEKMRYFVKKVLLKNLQNLQENAYARASI